MGVNFGSDLCYIRKYCITELEIVHYSDQHSNNRPICVCYLKGDLNKGP